MDACNSPPDCYDGMTIACPNRKNEYRKHYYKPPSNRAEAFFRCEQLDGSTCFLLRCPTDIHKNNGYDVGLVQRLLQHSSAATTQRYVGIEPQRIEQAIENLAQLL